MDILEFIRSHASTLPNLVKFALGMAILIGVPAVSRRVKLPPVVGLLLCGILIGPHVLGVFPVHPVIADFFSDLGKLLLMFFAGLEIDLTLFRQVRTRSIAFGLMTTFIPLVFGTGVGLWFGYPPIAAVVLGSLLASHTLLGLPIITELGESRLEPITVTVGATVMSDTLSLIVFAICAGIYHSGFSVTNLAIQLFEIAVFVPLVLFGMSRLGAYLLKKEENNESSYFVLMLAIMVVAGILAQSINLPGIVGAFLAGLAINVAVRDKPVKGRLEFFANTLFIPAFFIVTGFLIDPVIFVRSLIDNFPIACAVILALVIGKWIAAEIAGHAFQYSSAARLTVWSLTLPQVAATLAAALVAFNTMNKAGERLVDDRLLNVVLVLMLTTAILGPVLTAYFAPRMLPKKGSESVPHEENRMRAKAG
jgi:Kef-type K+ transport system membrane component KefB